MTKIQELIIVVLVIMIVLIATIKYVPAQGIYMLNGRATPSVIVGADGGIFPVVPGPQFAGPSPMILAPPLPWRVPQRYAVPAPYARPNVYGPPSPPCYCSAY